MNALGILIEYTAALAKELRGMSDAWEKLRRREIELQELQLIQSEKAGRLAERNVIAQERLALATEQLFAAASEKRRGTT